MVTQLELSNMIMRDVEGVKESGLPLDAFPEKVQEIILNLHREDGYSMEYTADGHSNWQFLSCMY